MSVGEGAQRVLQVSFDEDRLVLRRAPASEVSAEGSPREAPGIWRLVLAGDSIRTVTT